MPGHAGTILPRSAETLEPHQKGCSGKHVCTEDTRTSRTRREHGWKHFGRGALKTLETRKTRVESITQESAELASTWGKTRGDAPDKGKLRGNDIYRPLNPARTSRRCRGGWWSPAGLWDGPLPGGLVGFPQFAVVVLLVLVVLVVFVVVVVVLSSSITV